MKKKIIASTILVIIFSLGIITSFFMLISNYNYMEYSKKMLEEYSKTTVYFLNENNQTTEQSVDKIKMLANESRNEKIRIIYSNINGTVLYDSVKGKDNSYNLSIIKSEAISSNKDFVEGKLKNGDSIVFIDTEDNSKLMHSKDIKYYFYALIITLTIGIIITSRVMNSIVKPIEELQVIASRISRGDFNKRVNVKSNDELGSLGESFNNMADKLEETMAELLNKQIRLTSILESIGSGIIAIDKNDKIILLNPCAKEIFKLENKGNLIGESIYNIIEDKNITEIIKDNIEKSEIIVTKPTEKYLKIKLNRITEGINGGTVISIEDITDYKILENMRRDFVANVSHELKTPITSIKGFAETLKYVDDEETRNRFLGIVEEESDRLTRLIEDILSLYEIESKENKITKSLFKINNNLDNIKLIVEGNAKKKNININLINKSEAIIYGNQDRFKQMILNIVDNAIKYGGENNSIWINSKDIGDKVIIEIKDNGIGISKDHLDRIFERFYRVDKARSRSNGGTGLGLAIVKHIVKNFEGNISVYSEVSKGTKFIIEIPIYNENFY